METLAYQIGLGHQFKSQSKKLSACLSSLNEAYAHIADLHVPGLKEAINEALTKASIEAVAADDQYDEKD